MKSIITKMEKLSEHTKNQSTPLTPYMGRLRDKIVESTPLNVVEKSSIDNAFELKSKITNFKDLFPRAIEHWDMPKFYIIKEENRHDTGSNPYLYCTIVKDDKLFRSSECSYSFEQQMLISLQIICKAPRDFCLLTSRMLGIDEYGKYKN